MKLFFLSVILSLTLLGQDAGPLMKSIQTRYATAKLNLIESAEAMPESDYSYKLTPPQRSFANWIEHNIEMNYNLCSSLKGEKSPKEKFVKDTAPKAALEKGLKESFQYCDSVFVSMTDEKALKEVTTPSGQKILPANIMIGLLNSWNQHYGNLVGYLRTKGVTPPSTARSQKKK